MIEVEWRRNNAKLHSKNAVHDRSYSIRWDAYSGWAFYPSSEPKAPTS
jgi:hypothetical protein